MRTFSMSHTYREGFPITNADFHGDHYQEDVKHTADGHCLAIVTPHWLRLTHRGCSSFTTTYLLPSAPLVASIPIPIYAGVVGVRVNNRNHNSPQSFAAAEGEPLLVAFEPAELVIVAQREGQSRNVGAIEWTRAQIVVIEQSLDQAEYFDPPTRSIKVLPPPPTCHCRRAIGGVLSLVP